MCYVALVKYLLLYVSYRIQVSIFLILLFCEIDGLFWFPPWFAYIADNCVDDLSVRLKKMYAEVKSVANELLY